MEVVYGYMTEDDIGAVSALEEKAFSVSWSKEGIKRYLDAGHTLFITAKTDEKLIGYIAVFCALDEGNLVSIAVDDGYRNMGIAGEMLDIAYDELKKNDVTSINLEVRKSNEAARSLYEKEGFEETGIRKGFYKQPAEDAVLYIKRL